jgi:hypothetical protein
VCSAGGGINAGLRSSRGSDELRRGAGLRHCAEKQGGEVRRAGPEWRTTAGVLSGRVVGRSRSKEPAEGRRRKRKRRKKKRKEEKEKEKEKGKKEKEKEKEKLGKFWEKIGKIREKGKRGLGGIFRNFGCRRNFRDDGDGKAGRPA